MTDRRSTVVRRFGLVVLVLVCGTGIPLSAQPGGPKLDRPDSEAAHSLERVINQIVELGYVESVSTVEVRSELDQPTTVVTVVPEGSDVRKGDLLIRLDASELETKIVQQEIRLATAEALGRSAEEELATSKKTLAALTKAAELRIEIAMRQRETYLADDGEYQVVAGALKREIEIADEESDLATQMLQQLAEIAKLKEGAVEREIAESRSAILAARARVLTAKAKLALLERHQKPQEMAIRELAILEAKADLMETRGELGKRVRMAASQAIASRAEVAENRRILEGLRRQIAACQVHAPKDGVVVYAHQYSRRGGPAEFVVEPGAVVRPRQVILQLPDLSRLQLKVAVNETKIARVRPGQSVSIQIDALADVKLTGRVSRVNQFPEPTSWLNNGVKEFGVIISIADPPRSIRLGMTAFATIDVGSHAED